MWRFAIVALLQGCDPEAPPPPGDAAPAPCNLPADVPSCAATCGNGQIDVCYTLQPACVTVVASEICDGAVTCEAAGYFGGTAVCASGCDAIDDADCNACPPGLACETYTATLPSSVAVSGSRIAVATITGIDIFDGLTFVKHVGVTYARQLVPVPNGWLVSASQPSRIFFLDRDGAQGSASPIEEPDALISFGAGNRALLTWRPLVETDAKVAIVDAGGASVIAASNLFSTGITDIPGTVSDGTSFFVGAGGQLARITPDGTRSYTTQFPASFAGDTVTLRWSGSVGWYISWNRFATSFIAQRFDAAGAKVGNNVYVDLSGYPPRDFVADGNELLVLRQRVTKYELVRVSATGTKVVVREFGAGPPKSERAWLAWLDTDVVAAWYRPGKLQLALTAP